MGEPVLCGLASVLRAGIRWTFPHLQSPPFGMRCVFFVSRFWLEVDPLLWLPATAAVAQTSRGQLGGVDLVRVVTVWVAFYTSVYVLLSELSRPREARLIECSIIHKPKLGSFESQSFLSLGIFPVDFCCVLPAKRRAASHHLLAIRTYYYEYFILYCMLHAALSS